MPWEVLITIVVTNLATAAVTVWNFRVKLEARLTKLETKVDLILTKVGY